MEYNNNATRIRREVLIRLAQAFEAGTLAEDADAIPYAIRPKDSDATRCCIYRDRAVLRYRCMAAMGFSIEDEVDDSTRLATYAEAALQREEVDGPIMTVLDIACKGCTPSRHMITDACQGCMARPCAINCPFDAISFTNGRAVINREKCIDCGKCRQVCPYNAVTRIPIPCEEACPVKAIRKGEDGKAHINFEACISCGRCMRSCPFGAIMERSQMIDVLKAFRRDAPVVAMVAPAIVGQFPGDLEQIADALLRIGFTKVVEVALGADITTRKEAAEFVERMEHGKPFMTTSCCPAYIETVRRHVPELKPYVSDTATPMHYTAEWVKQSDPDAVTVFIGPCVAKRREGLDDPHVDYVLTFEEVGALLVANDIEVAVCDGVPLTEGTASAEGRGFPVSGGVTAAVQSAVGDQAEVNAVSIDGLDPKAISDLRAYACGRCPGNLIEVMACKGGCVGGMGVIGHARFTSRAVAELCQKSRPLLLTADC